MKNWKFQKVRRKREGILNIDQNLSPNLGVFPYFWWNKENTSMEHQPILCNAKHFLVLFYMNVQANLPTLNPIFSVEGIKASIKYMNN